jgi:predicted metal-dependent hydrolase
MDNPWQRGVALFNQGHYWECHEALEPLWLKSRGLDRHFYGGIILLAAALHKAHVMNSPRGGRRNYAKALTHLALVPDTYLGVNVRNLEASVHKALSNPKISPKL